MGKKAVSSKTKWQVIGMHKMKMSNRQIGRHLNISEFSVRTTIKNYQLVVSIINLVSMINLVLGVQKNCKHTMKTRFTR